MKFCIIGLGSFGTHLARQLNRDGHEIIAVDNDPGHIHALKDEIEYLIQADCTDIDAFHEIPIDACDVVIVAIGKVLGIPEPTRAFEPADVLVLFGLAKDVRRMMADHGVKA